LVSHPGGSGWRYLGSSSLTWTNRTGQPASVSLRTNDDVPGNGAFGYLLQRPCRG
jgi:hypothetical protein